MKRLLSAILERVRRLPKGQRFMVFLALAGLVGATGSAATYLTVLRSPAGRAVKIALIAPLSGPQAELGRSLRDGVTRWAAGQAGAPSGGHRITLAVFDEATTPDALTRAADDPDVVAVIGPLQDRPETAAVPATRGLPQITLAGAPSGEAGWSFPLSADPAYEARFLANYVRNVIGEKLVSIIRPDAPDQAAIAAAFDETLQRFGTRVVYNWPIAGAGEARQTALRARAAAIAEQKIAGAILVLGEPDFAAEAVAALGAAETGNRVIGLRALATDAFLDRLREAWQGPGSLGATLNGTLLTTPLLFDTAGVQAQEFQAAFRAATGRAPDWVALLGHDAGQVIGAALATLTAPVETSGSALRAGLRTALLAHRSPETALPGLAGPLFFEDRSGGALPTLVGSFDGQELVAAQIQLSPIRDEGVSNYLEQLTAGRVLYVNDRFMYKTNVVSTGIRLTKITDFNVDANTAELEFMLWFRWRGGFAPQEVVFENAVQPVVLGTPERVADDGDLHYRAWRVHGRFFLNFSKLPRPYGSQMAGITFRHRTLARNNLMYVADIVGMDLAGPGQAAAAETGWLARLTGAASGSSVLAGQLEEARVLAGAVGWVVDQALISQELARAGTDGDPGYVGFGKPPPLFSTLAMDVIVKPDAIDVRALVPDGLLIYLAIFALCGAVLAHLLDRRDRGQFWRMQTLVLRLVTWPVLLATCSVLALDYAVAQAGMGVVETVDFVSRAAWWLVPARLLALTVERFVWVPLEARTQRRVPTVFRMIVALLIYSLAGLGVVAFVLGKTITSLLATSGVLAMIVGLAVQSNLKDIFSGLMLNLERPFVLNDWVRINRTYGQVVDVSWRTTRLRGADDQIIAFPNGKVAEAEIENLTRAGAYDAGITVYMDPRCPPEEVLAALRRAVAAVTDVAFKCGGMGMTRVENVNGSWAARYYIDAWTERPGGLVFKLKGALWRAIWVELTASGLIWGLGPTLPAEARPALAMAAE